MKGVTVAFWLICGVIKQLKIIRTQQSFPFAGSSGTKADTDSQRLYKLRMKLRRVPYF